MKKQIQKITIRTPFIVNFTFFFLLILPVLLLSIQKVSAKTDCRTEWNNGFFQQIDPTIQKQCGKKFQLYTRWEIKRYYINNNK